jgi:small neutral amino acid transporter SnatA (MarC family)
MKTLTSLICRVLFVFSFLLAGLAVGEKLANLWGYTVLRSSVAAGRLLEIAAISLLFVIALLLREVAHSLRAKSAA